MAKRKYFRNAFSRELAGLTVLAFIAIFFTLVILTSTTINQASSLIFFNRAAERPMMPPPSYHMPGY